MGGRTAAAQGKHSFLADSDKIRTLAFADGIWWQIVVFVPDDADIEQKTLKELQDFAYAEHMGVSKACSNIQRYFT